MIRRTGKFYVSTELVEETKFHFFLEKLKFIPYRVEHLFHDDMFEYVGASPKFDEVEEGSIVPEYTMTITLIDGEITGVNAIKIDKN